MTDFETAVANVLRSLQPGDVVTYGEVALEAGYAGAARAVGNFLATKPGYPWWRVVTTTGRLAPHSRPKQAALLRSEGIDVKGDRVRFPREF